MERATAPLPAWPREAREGPPCGKPRLRRLLSTTEMLSLRSWKSVRVGSALSERRGAYSFFNQGVNIYAAHAFEVPETLPAGSLHDLLTVFLDPVHGSGGILNVVNDTGGSSTAANPDVPVTVVNYP